MLGILFCVLIGIVIGWNLPQPAYAKVLQDQIVNKWKELTGQKDDSSGKS